MIPLPICTAPKDGTWVLVGGGCIDPLEWDGTQPAWVSAKYHDSEWVFDYWDGAFRSIYIGPTHWLPIPSIP